MDLWSKGLGKRVLSMDWAQYEGIDIEGDSLVVKGVLGAPVFWNYTVTLTEQDYIDFFRLITKDTGTVDFVIHSKKRWSIYFRVVRKVTKFLWMAFWAIIKSFFVRKKTALSQ